ncbi:sterol 3-beta-glucosyltransferase UGT80A2 isoform X4 [Vigna angularis]|uniref:sterol 3-beta-glucosyltransferase UGT80A2 isoform X4 n=1 Tax=Phaseolus angularis TaxID=3914 RepID=UPI0022B382AA|nr:sterol 3-beta-glucosyltransferase UGT80A2 isoform X4 [Vigna angularis]
MAKENVLHRATSSSSDISVCLDTDATSAPASAGPVHRNPSYAERGTPAPTPAPAPVNGDNDLTRVRSKGSSAVALAKFLDAKVPFREKVQWIKRASVLKADGTVEIKVPGIGSSIHEHHVKCDEPHDEFWDAIHNQDIRSIKPLQIVMLIVGTRGDVQPFIAMGKRLQEDGHRVRLATHKNFEDFVLNAGLEFYPLGGDPKVLAGWHTHVAEYLKVPLHVFFTMPWTPTSEFPHPLSRVKQPIGYRLSYQIVDALIWLGIRDLINEFRKKKLKLKPVTYLSGSYTHPFDVPHGYMWSPHLVPKPKDWGPKIDVVGFCFLDLASTFDPPKSLVDWLEEGEKPIYVGFGSLPLQEPEKMTKIIIQALEKTGQRGVINRGWGGLGSLAERKKSVYLLDNCPHDWLFPRCTAVIHHGGAGTTAAGLRAECPTTIVPFFGDQPFWGERVHARGVGPAPIPVDEFTLDRLVDAIHFMLKPEVKRRAVELANSMKNEDGVLGAVKAFYKYYPDQKSRCEEAKALAAVIKPKPIHKYFSLRGCLGCSTSSVDTHRP